MSTMGTFDAFTSARLGIYAAQHGLRVTGNNISNINTVGYTRQRLDQVSFKAGAYDRYRSQLDNHVGSGALVMNINQVRDPYLDVRFRNISADVGYRDTMLSGLQNIADILDEVGKGEDKGDNEVGDGILHAQIEDLRKKLVAYADQPTKANDDLVRGAAELLCGTLNSYAKKLDVYYKETVEDFNSKVTEINECLTNIRDLNREIRDNEIFGDNALELRDERNRQIDTLSQYLHIKVVYSEEDVGSGQKVEKLSIYLNDDNPDNKVRTDESMLIDGVFGAQLSSPEKRVVINPYFGSTDPALKDVANFLYASTEQLKDADGKLAYLVDDEVKYYGATDTPPAGAKAVMRGTNFVDQAQKVDNDIFAVQISKLLDIKGNEWEDRTSEYEMVGPEAFTNYEIQLTLPAAADRADGKELKIGEKVFTFKDTPAGANEISSAITDADLTALIARNLANNDYTIRAHPDTTGKATTLVFTAKKPGSAASLAAEGIDPPSVDVNPAGTDLNATLMGISQDGQDLPANKKDPDTGIETLYTYVQSGTGWKKATTILRHTNEVALDDNDLHGSLQAVRELLTESGEFTTKDMVSEVDEKAGQKRGIPYYQRSLDLLAKEFAKQYNKLNQGIMLDENGNPKDSITGTIEDLKALGVRIDKAEDTVGGFGDGYYVRADGTFMGTSVHATCNLDLAKLTPEDSIAQAVNKIRANVPLPNFGKNTDGTEKTEAEQLNDLKDFLKEHGVSDDNAGTEKVTLTNPIQMGGPLFSNRNDNDDTTGITASNISVAHSWTNGSVQLVPKYEVLFDGDLVHSTQNINADHMVSMLDKNLLFNPQDIVGDAVSSNLFQGDFYDMFNGLNTTLGKDIRANNIALNTAYTQQVEIDTSRDGVSGVDLNDEAMNMVQFQKAMNAAMRLMTVIDEALDRLINNTGVAGR